MMMSLTMGTLLHVLFLFALNIPWVKLTTALVVLNIPLVVFMAWVMAFLFR